MYPAHFQPPDDRRLYTLAVQSKLVNSRLREAVVRRRMMDGRGHAVAKEQLQHFTFEERMRSAHLTHERVTAATVSPTKYLVLK